MTTLTKADIAEHLLSVAELTRKEAKEITELFYKLIAGALTKAQQVKISGFGNFELHDKSERPGRNPKTGESIPVKARRVVTFHSGQKLRARVESFTGNPVKEETETES